MPEEQKVWAVRLGTGDPDEIECRMSLDFGELVFSSEDGEIRVPTASIRRARRVRGSPVMMLDYEHSGGEVRAAVFFVKPPPLPGASGKSRRKTRKDSVAYLSIRNRHMKELVNEWVVAVVEASRGGATG